MKDRKKKEIILNKSRETKLPLNVSGNSDIQAYLDQKEGIVRIDRNTLDESDGEFHIMQEQHNANHALYYFNMLADGLISGRSTGNDCRKLVRVREHMMNLREFIGDDKGELKSVIEILLKKLEEFCPVRRRQFAQLLVENWEMIQSFSQIYINEDHKCLTEEQLSKLKDVLSGRCYLRLWWWKIRYRRVRVMFKKIVKGVTK